MAFFDKDFKKEDLLLYLIAIGLLVFFGWFFVESRKEILDTIQYNEQSLSKEQAMVFEMTRMRYAFAAKALAANSLRNNFSFLVGTILCILGTLVVVRRLRDSIDLSVSDENRQGSLRTNSAGVLLAVLGSVIIIVSILFKDKYSITDNDGAISPKSSSAKNPGDKAGGYKGADWSTTE